LYKFYKLKKIHFLFLFLQEHFLYVGKCNVTDLNVNELIKVAGELDVRAFESIATDYLSPILDKDLIKPKLLLEYLLLFSKYKYTTLKEKCVGLIASKGSYITQTKCWKELYENNPTVVTNLMLKL
jgi:hypothetical protein